MENIHDIIGKANRHIEEAPRPDLEYIYSQLKDKYNLALTTGLALDAGFAEDLQVLTGKSSIGRFYLYHNGMDLILDYDTEEGISGNHWHPADTAEALGYVVAFMEGKTLL